MRYESVKPGIMKENLYQWLVHVPSISTNHLRFINTPFDIFFDIFFIYYTLNLWKEENNNHIPNKTCIDFLMPKSDYFQHQVWSFHVSFTLFIDSGCPSCYKV